MARKRTGSLEPRSGIWHAPIGLMLVGATMCTRERPTSEAVQGSAPTALKEPTTEIDRLAEQCKAKEGAARCFDLGLMYEKGNAVPMDLTRAAEFFRAACDKGHAEGCTYLALLFQLGSTDAGGVAVDEVRGAQLLGRACSGGDLPGCDELSSCYWRGSGVPKDTARSIALRDETCQRGYGWSCLNLGHLYAEGPKILPGAPPADRTKALEYYDKALHSKEADAREMAAQDIARLKRR